MKLYLAAIENNMSWSVIEQIRQAPKDVYVLGSFAYISQCKAKYSLLLPCFKDFMLDSGAFSFMNNIENSLDWYTYLEKYAAYINENQIEKFFELDIDSIVGYDKVKEYRAILEKLVGRPCIPVWHRSRGRNEFIRLCSEYSYIAVGGIAIKHIRHDEYKYFRCLINEAHRRNCKIHALGFTNLTDIYKYHFDSVDSSSWTSGGRYGSLYIFRHGRMQLFRREDGKRVADYKELNGHNFSEWVKFQKYAEVKL